MTQDPKLLGADSSHPAPRRSMTSDRARPDLPVNTATPAEVRSYITSMLITTRDLSTSHASRIASCWTLGTGRDLRSYPATFYRHLFGLEEGWIVFKEVKVLVLRENAKQYSAGFYCISAGFAVMSLCTLLIYSDGLISSETGRSICWVILAGVGSLVVPLAFLSILPKTSHDCKAEDWLHSHYFSAPQPPEQESHINDC